MNNLAYINVRLKQKKEIIIYGAGGVGKLVYRYLAGIGLGKKVTAFATSETEEDEYCEGIPVLDIDTVSKLYASRMDVCIIVAVGEKLLQELVKNCELYGIKDYKVITNEIRTYMQSYLNQVKIRVGIFGSCISRDVFELDTEGKYSVCAFTNFSSIFSQMAPKLYHVEEQEIGHPSKFMCKVISYDINKSATEKLGESDADYLVIDLMSESYPLIKICAEAQELIVTKVHIEATDVFSRLINGKTIEVVEYEQLAPVQIQDSIERFCGKLKDLFDVKRIIFVETKWVPEYISFEGKICTFSENNIVKMNKRLSDIQEKMLYYLKGCNIIRFPENTRANEAHRWNLKPYHYTDEYYKYVYGEIEKICGEEA